MTAEPHAILLVALALLAIMTPPAVAALLLALTRAPAPLDSRQEPGCRTIILLGDRTMGIGPLRESLEP